MPTQVSFLFTYPHLPSYNSLPIILLPVSWILLSVAIRLSAGYSSSRGLWSLPAGSSLSPQNPPYRLSLSSHIFCIDCSNDLGLNSAPNDHRICPACQTSLSNPDDAVSTQLNPTEDYKTSVLSGLSPSTIMKCAGRGLAFWSYQATQEMSCVVHLIWRIG